MILTGNLRNRALAITNRITEEKQRQETENTQLQQTIRNLVVEEFRALFKAAVPQEVIDGLNIEIQHRTKYGGWVVQTEGPHFKKPVGVEAFAVIRLPGENLIEITARQGQKTPEWHLSVPLLSDNKRVWRKSHPLGWVDPKKSTLENTILTAVYDFEQNWAVYEEAIKKDEKAAEAKRQREEQKERDRQVLIASLEAEDELIEGLIEAAIEPYAPRWVEGVMVRIFVWRYCSGAVEGEFDYAEIYSLSPHMSYDEELNKSFVSRIDGGRIALDMNVHKPVIREVVLDSLESAEEKLGAIAFYKPSEYSLPLEGVHREYIQSHHYWQFGGEGRMRFYQDDQHGRMMKPWLRSLLGLPELPEFITISEPTH